MKIATLALIISSLCGIDLKAETLNDWVLSKIQEDKQLWIKAISRIDGYQFELLQSSKSYVPFFMEMPEVGASVTARDAGLFENWKNRGDNVFLPGGYIYRLKFKTLPTLYAVSAGEWSGRAWHSIASGKDVEIEPEETWENLSGNSLYTSLLAGARPRLVSYSQSGEVVHQETFDASGADFERRLQAAIVPYTRSGKPVLEMISLAEYLKQPLSAWRAVDIVGKFNLRNQHLRPDEQKRLKEFGNLNRSAAVQVLTTGATIDVQTKPTQNSPEFSTPKKVLEAKPTSTTPSEKPASLTPWSIMIVIFVASAGLLWLLLKRRS